MVYSGSTGEKASGEGVFQGETTTWNIADGFTKINVLKILIEINLYEVMAKFGKQHLEEEINNSEIATRRVEGFDRMIFALRQIISNCMFQIDKDDKTKVEELIERVDFVESKAENIATEFTNEVTKETELRINEEHFRNCLDTLSDIKKQLHFYLNRAGLIFRKGEETDLDEFMASVYNG